MAEETMIGAIVGFLVACGLAMGIAYLLPRGWQVPSFLIGMILGVVLPLLGAEIDREIRGGDRL
jgi:MFS family permease